MGVFGLRRFIDASSCTRFLPETVQDAEKPLAARDLDKTHGTAGNSALSSSPAATPHVDHVLVDLNCIIHSCFGRDAATMRKRDAVQAVLEKLRALLTLVVVPRVSLTICIDGPAPYAKLQTQRLRRRRLALLDTGSAQQLTSLAVTPGSLFLVELENALAAQFKLRGGRGFLPHFVPVFLHGSTAAGEGEAKIARALAHVATASLSRGERYNPNHTVVVIGNDIDLTLTCLGATQYHNLFVVGPSSMQLISVSEMLYRWLRGGTQGAGEFRLTVQELASVRVDFVFLFLLNGGDHYAGVGDVAPILWKRYRTVRAASMRRCLVAPDLMSIDVDFLSDVLQASDYTGDCDAGVGMELLRASLWSLYTTVTGVCPDYQYIPAPMSPHLNHLRAAVLHCLKNRRGIRIQPRRDARGPLTPLETFVALMPTEATLPASVAQALRSSRKYETIAQQLFTSNDAAMVADAAKQAVEVAGEFLMVSEQCLRDFTSPVQLNVLQPPRRLSRHEQHRMLASKGRIEREEPIPLVECVTLPESFEYVTATYPSYVKDLLFLSPFCRAAEALSSSNRGVTTSMQPFVAGTVREARRRQKCKRGSSDGEVRRIPVHMQSSEEPSAARQLQKTLEKASSLAMPEGRDKKTLRRLKKKLNAQRQLVEKQSRSEESSAETKRHMLRQNDKAFIAEIRRFLGEEDEDVRQLLRHDGGRAPGNTGQEERPMKKQKSVSRAGDKVELCGRKRRRESAETLSVTRADEEGDRHESSYGGCKAAKRGRREVSHTENHHHTAAGAARTCGRDTREAVNGSSSEQPTLKKKKKKRASREMGATSSH
ncbi:hypothetical protein C3747_6g658 [Trypanosoma cruzi]|uniref:Xrn1 N-terminal domain-containing protein n=3 Tax=Trypanosoma cruzi TaxID=5693 RepID=Q4DQL9_TRYCC|nr:hypothetical protein, conserved [Trypanosoma cruzi]EAN94832.1 hypothetical protein, conserved [Trypanosoma cruzi]PWV20394.1 hypothetical protein C3747_6g658 [Trypanosoma cruzi]|eukprot:XP_816683.1 hypothetical protein [Trypanosoma cruzi strain CL Brener]